MSTRRGDQGQSTVEFALVLPLVVLVVLFIVQAGLVVRDQLLVSHAAREAARAASVSDSDRLGAAKMAARQAGNLAAERVSATTTMVDGDASVRVLISYRSITGIPIIGSLVPDIDLESTVVMRVESDRKHRS
jgi:Flp pilus assembly protein TadG